MITEPLWPQSTFDVNGAPSLTMYPAVGDKLSAGVLVCPGGGYGALATGHEGEQIAQWLNARGVAAFVLRYSVVTAKRPSPLLDLPLREAKRAMRLIRAHADAYHLDPKRLGVWGFSAGGHLASTLSTHFDNGDGSADAIEKQSSRPDFSILCYPVVTMEAWTHGGSKRNLLGENPTAELVAEYSNERHIGAQTPPAFLFHTSDDGAVPVENAIQYYRALRQNNIPAEMHIYEHGNHGVGLAPTDKVLSTWSARLEDWLRTRGAIDKAAP